MNNISDYAIRLFFHFLVVLGIWKLVKPLIDEQLRYIAKKREYRKNAKHFNEASKRNKRFIYRHLDNLLYLTQDKYEPFVSVTKFILQSGFLLVGIFIITLLTMQELPSLFSSDPFFDGNLHTSNIETIKSVWKLPMLLAILAGSIPYIVMRYKYTKRQTEGSYDLLDVVKIYAKYTYLSVDAALYATSDFLMDNNVLKRPLRILADEFSNYSNETMLQGEAQRFASTVSTTFARIFISDLLDAEKEGNVNLNLSLLELNDSMEQQRETILTVKANNSDAIKLGLYGNLLVFVLSIGTFMFMLKPGLYFKLQFQTPIGVTFFMIIVISFVIAFLFSILLSRPKLDYQ